MSLSPFSQSFLLLSLVNSLSLSLSYLMSLYLSKCLFPFFSVFPNSITCQFSVSFSVSFSIFPSVSFSVQMSLFPLSQSFLILVQVTYLYLFLCHFSLCLSLLSFFLLLSLNLFSVSLLPYLSWNLVHFLSIAKSFSRCPIRWRWTIVPVITWN